MIWFTLLTAAHAWDTIYPSPYMWDTSEPIVVNLGEEAAPGLTAQETQDAMRAALDAWSGIACTGGLELVAGTVGPSEHTFDLGDGESWFTVGDPDDYLEPVTNGATLVSRSGSFGALSGQNLQQADHGDIAINDDVTFTTAAAIDAGECTDSIELESVLTFLVGHLVGLGRSDEPGSVMNNWNPAPCTRGPTAPTADDIVGLQSLYGFPDEVVCTLASDVAPTEVTCEVVTPEGLTTPNASWRLPDGSTTTGLSASFVAEGPSLAEVCLTRDACSGAEHCDLVPIAMEPGPWEPAPEEPTNTDPGEPLDSGAPGGTDTDADEGGCNQAPASPGPLAVLALGLLAGVRRRSRR